MSYVSDTIAEIISMHIMVIAIIIIYNAYLVLSHSWVSQWDITPKSSGRSQRDTTTNSSG